MPAWLFAATCPEHTFFTLPTWYKYLNANGKMDFVNGHCEIATTFSFPSDVVLIVLALLDIALRIAGLVAIVFVIYGGIQMVTSQGDPESVKHARKTITNALIGLVIALLATAIVAFVGTKVV